MNTTPRTRRVASLAAALALGLLAACSTTPPVVVSPADVKVHNIHGNRWNATSSSMAANRARADQVCAEYRMKARSEYESATRSQRIFHATGDGTSLTGSWVMHGQDGQQLVFRCI